MPDILDSPKTELTQSSVLDALNNDDSSNDDSSNDDPKVKEEIKLEPLDDDKSDDDKSDDDKLDDQPEETIKVEDKKEDDLEYEEVPNRQKILKEYPEIFKKFPGIERAIYREDQYTRIFPSINDAKHASERLETFSQIENDLFSGNIENLLTAVKKNDDKAFNKITDNLIITLGKVDSGAQTKLGNYVVKSLLSSALAQAKKIGSEEGEQLEIAAKLLNKFVYGNYNVEAPPEIKTEDEDPRAKELNREKLEFEHRKLESAVNDVTARAQKSVKSAIEKYIDPRNVMSEFVKNTAIDKVVNSVDKEINTDSRFRAHLDRLWIAAKESGYSEESKAKIRSAILKKAESVLPGFIKKVRADALKGSTPTKQVKKEKDDEPETRRVAQPANKSSSSKSPRASSVADVMSFLNRS